MLSHHIKKYINLIMLLPHKDGLISWIKIVYDVDQVASYYNIIANHTK